MTGKRSIEQTKAQVRSKVTVQKPNLWRAKEFAKFEIIETVGSSRLDDISASFAIKFANLGQPRERRLLLDMQVVLE